MADVGEKKGVFGIPLLIGAVGFGLAAALLSYIYLKSEEKALIEKYAGREGRPVTVLVAGADLRKGAVLRQDRPDHALLDALDAQLALIGARLAERRAQLLAELTPHVDAMYRALADTDGHVELVLRTSARGADERSRAEALAEIFARSRSTEVRRRRTLAGPQTDEVSIRLGGQPARRYASRGQVRSLVLALKLAELRAARERGAVPLFLLDDLSSELDRVRTRRLVALLADLGAQVFATTTDPEHVDALPAADTSMLAVREGRIMPVEST